MGLGRVPCSGARGAGPCWDLCVSLPLSTHSSAAVFLLFIGAVMYRALYFRCECLSTRA